MTAGRQQMVVWSNIFKKKWEPENWITSGHKLRPEHIVYNRLSKAISDISVSDELSPWEKCSNWMTFAGHLKLFWIWFTETKKTQYWHQIHLWAHRHARNQKTISWDFSVNTRKPISISILRTLHSMNKLEKDNQSLASPYSITSSGENSYTPKYKELSFVEASTTWITFAGHINHILD